MEQRGEAGAAWQDGHVEGSMEPGFRPHLGLDWASELVSWSFDFLFCKVSASTHTSQEWVQTCLPGTACYCCVGRTKGDLCKREGHRA